MQRVIKVLYVDEAWFAGSKERMREEVSFPTRKCSGGRPALFECLERCSRLVPKSPPFRSPVVLNGVGHFLFHTCESEMLLDV